MGVTLLSRASLTKWLTAYTQYKSLTHTERRALWNKHNRHKKIATDHKRRARKRATAIGPRDEQADFIKHVRTAERIKCHWCMNDVPRDDRHIDHIIPLSRGGADHVHNLCASCSGCNISKRAKMPEEFTGQGELSFAPVTLIGPSRRERRRAEAAARRERDRIAAKERRELMKTRQHIVPLCMGDVALVPLTRGQYAIVDKVDWSLVSVYMWNAQLKGGYWRAKRNTKKINGVQGIMLLNRQIAGVTDGAVFVRHVNGNQLDCRRSNLSIQRERVHGGRGKGTGWLDRVLASA